MKQISGNKLLVKALKEEGVEYVFGYPGACTIDISDELYKQDKYHNLFHVTSRHWFTQPMLARTTGKSWRVSLCKAVLALPALSLCLATATGDSVPLVLHRPGS